MSNERPTEEELEDPAETGRKGCLMQEELEDPAETGRKGCLIPELDDEGHCDTVEEEQDE
jgi:hypothetical protein